MKINYSILEENMIKYMKKKYDINISLEHLDLRLAELGLDSLDTVEMIITAEEKYGILITANEIDENHTFRDLIDLIYEKVKELPETVKSKKKK